MALLAGILLVVVLAFLLLQFQ